MSKDSDDEENNLQFETKTSRSGYGSRIKVPNLKLNTLFSNQ